MITNIDKIITRITYADNKNTEFKNRLSEMLNSTEVKIIPNIDESRKKADLYLHIRDIPDLEPLGIEFGEIVHNYRSILDNLVVNLALHLGYNRTDKGFKNLQFIICSDESEWKKNKDKLSILPEKFISLVKQLQPFNDLLETETKNCLLQLRDIDNEDKHYLHLVPNIDKLIGNADFEIKVEGNVNDDYKPKITKYKLVFQDGVKIAEMVIDYPMTSLKMNSEVRAQIVIKINNEVFDIFSLLNDLSYSVKIVTDFMQYSEDSNSRLILMKRIRNFI